MLASVAALTVAATLGGVWLTTGFGTVALPTAPAGPDGRAVAGPPVLTLDRDALGAGGVTLAALRAAPFRPIARRYARVVDPAPLFAQESRIAGARAALVAAQAKARLSRQEYARDQSLFAHHQSVSQQALMAAQAADETDAQKLVQAQAQLDDLLAGLRAQFGPAFLEGAGAQALLAKLRDHAAALVAVSLPGPGSPADRIRLETEGGGRIGAGYLSAAPVDNAKAAGPTAYYLADQALEIGSQPMALVPLGAARAGVFVPESAVIWFGGQRWVYVAGDGGGLVRHALPDAADLQPAEGGYVAAKGFAAGQRIVTRGAQLLLSQETRPKDIKTECPDPPECDG
ncbi:hypothetical protein U879_18050 [Defluviimonas sp. 20V17]|nr:hypothetical protein U879_18050 [Defluviimonas sp. 20V17]